MPEAPPQRADDPGVAAARVRAIELALAGLSREDIAAELSGSLASGALERLLDDVLSG